jgi:hypothetical protein
VHNERTLLASVADSLLRVIVKDSIGILNEESVVVTNSRRSASYLNAWDNGNIELLAQLYCLLIGQIQIDLNTICIGICIIYTVI